MPFDWLAEWKPDQASTKDDQDWSALTRGFARALVKLEPRVRFRIRQVPPAASLSTEGKGGKAKGVASGAISLTDNDVSEDLRDRLEIPAAREWWVRTYQCYDCSNPKTGKKPAWVPDIRRRLHRDHDLRPGKITHKGVAATWNVSHRLFSGHPSKIGGMAGLGYSVALTTMPDDPKKLAGFDTIMILPKAKMDYTEASAKVKRAVGCEHVVVLPSNPADAVKKMFETLLMVDPAFLQPETPSDELPDADDAELQQQIEKDRMAQAFLRQAAQKAPAAISGANPKQKLLEATKTTKAAKATKQTTRKPSVTKKKNNKRVK